MRVANVAALTSLEAVSFRSGRSPKMASVMTAEFVRSGSHADAPPFSLIEQKSLSSRLVQQLAAAARELARDPRGFIRDLFSANTKDARRSRRIRIGMACAVLAHCALLVLIAVLGRTMLRKPAVETPLYEVTFARIAASGDTTEPAHDVAKGDRGGGGGGGRNTPTPASKGQLPKFSPLAPIMAPRPEPTPRPPLLVLPETIQVDPRLEPKRDELAATGLPNGVLSPPSAGSGSGGGMGTGENGGMGPDSGRGAGPGIIGGKGGGRPGPLDGSGSVIPNAIDFNRINALPGYKSWSWIHRPRPIITPEAAAEKVIGVVLLRATFNADGTITNIELVMPVNGMNESAIEALRKSTFRPATINGLPVTVRRVPIQVSVHY